MKHFTHGGENLTTLLVKYFNDLLVAQTSERNRNEVTFFYVGDVLCIHLGSKYVDCQEKILNSNVTTMKSLELFPEISSKIFS